MFQKLHLTNIINKMKSNAKKKQKAINTINPLQKKTTHKVMSPFYFKKCLPDDMSIYVFEVLSVSIFFFSF